MSDRYAHAYERMLKASNELLTDDTTEGQTLLHLLIDNELYGDQLMDAIEMAEQYLAKKGQK